MEAGGFEGPVIAVSAAHFRFTKEGMTGLQTGT
jgi:hypothetical protein